jgi:hypothetical protein
VPARTRPLRRLPRTSAFHTVFLRDARWARSVLPQPGVSEITRRHPGSQQSANEIFVLAAEEKVERRRVSVENAKKQAPIKRERIVFVSLAIALPILIAVFTINVLGVSVASLFEMSPSPVVARAEAQQTLDTLVADIELYRRDYNRLPKQLVEVGRPPKGSWTYTVSGSDYRVQGTLYGQSVSYASTSAPRTAK